MAIAVAPKGSGRDTRRGQWDGQDTIERGPFTDDGDLKVANNSPRVRNARRRRSCWMIKLSTQTAASSASQGHPVISSGYEGRGWNGAGSMRPRMSTSC